MIEKQQGRFWTILGVLPKPPEQEDPEKKRVLQVCETNFSDMLTSYSRGAQNGCWSTL